MKELSQMMSIINIIPSDIVYIESFNCKFVDPNAGQDVVIDVTDIILNGESSESYICNDFKISGLFIEKYTLA